MVKGSVARYQSHSLVIYLSLHSFPQPLTPPRPTSLSFSISATVNGEETDLYFGSSPQRFMLEWQRRLLYFLRWPQCGNWECLTSLAGVVTPANIRVEANSVLTQKSRALHRAWSFVYIKILSLRAAAGCQADCCPTPTPFLTTWIKQIGVGEVKVTITVRPCSELTLTCVLGFDFMYIALITSGQILLWMKPHI